MKVDKKQQKTAPIPPQMAKPADKQAKPEPQPAKPAMPVVDEVEEASQESFPASDPPAFTPSHS